MEYDTLMMYHLATVVPCFFLGIIIFLIKKGTKIHRSCGALYMGLMMITAIITLFMQAQVGPRFLNHFGWIHSFSFLTIYSVPTALIAVRRGQIKKHKYKMISLYIGAIMIAGGFTFVPGRYLYQLFFGA